MDHIIYRQSDFSLPPIDRKEVLRYAGAPAADGTLEALFEKCAAEVSAAAESRVCYRILPVRKTEGGVDLDKIAFSSANLKTALGDFPYAVLFAATIGIKIDRLIAKYSRLSPATALLIEAIGNERIEAVCDCFQQQMADLHGGAGLRYSPGYGDLPLAAQRDVFSLLDCSRTVGITLNESLLMTPVKSVTAIFGIAK